MILRKIPEVEINANYFFNDSVNDSRCVVLHILQLKPVTFQLGFTSVNS
jgi:hypothetical protein